MDCVIAGTSLFPQSGGEGDVPDPVEQDSVIAM